MHAAMDYLEIAFIVAMTAAALSIAAAAWTLLRGR
jgi:hypothetical protein